MSFDEPMSFFFDAPDCNYMTMTQGNRRVVLPMETCLTIDGAGPFKGTCNGNVGSFGFYTDKKCLEEPWMDDETIAGPFMDGGPVKLQFHCDKQIACDPSGLEGLRRLQSSSDGSSIAVDERQNSVSPKFTGLLSTGLVAVITVAVCMIWANVWLNEIVNVLIPSNWIWNSLFENMIHKLWNVKFHEFDLLFFKDVSLSFVGARSKLFIIFIRKSMCMHQQQWKESRSQNQSICCWVHQCRIEYVHFRTTVSALAEKLQSMFPRDEMLWWMKWEWGRERHWFIVTSCLRLHWSLPLYRQQSTCSGN